MRSMSCCSLIGFVPYKLEERELMEDLEERALPYHFHAPLNISPRLFGESNYEKVVFLKENEGILSFFYHFIPRIFNTRRGNSQQLTPYFTLFEPKTPEEENNQNMEQGTATEKQELAVEANSIHGMGSSLFFIVLILIFIF